MLRLKEYSNGIKNKASVQKFLKEEFRKGKFCTVLSV